MNIKNMKLKNKYIIAASIIGGTLSVTSCNDVLDVDHPSQTDASYVFSNTDDATDAINGVYVKFCEDPFTSRMSNAWMQNTDVEVMCPNSGNPSGGHRSDLWGLQASEDVSFSDIYKAWNNNLEAIELANNVISGCETSSIASDAEIKQIKGEAVCLKAWRYLMLCNFWGDVPYYDSPSKYGDVLDKPKTDKNIIFSRCLQQLVNCEGDMKWSDSNTGGIERCTRDFALGLIAKMSLFRAGYAMTKAGTMQKADEYLDTSNDSLAVTYTDITGAQKTARTCDDYYALAENYCKKLIQLKGRTLRSDYASIFEEQEKYTHTNNDEILYEVAFVQNRGGDVGWCIGVTNTNSKSNGNTTNQVGINPLYYMSFADNDVRRDATCSRYAHDNDTIKVCASTGMNVTKWDRYEASADLGASSSKGTGINWPMMRYSEVLLMLAEAENHLNGPTALAKEQLKAVRARAFSGDKYYTHDVTEYVDSVAGSKASFLNAIVNERAWEFGGECIRKWDLQRWNLYGEKINETIQNMNAWGISTVEDLMKNSTLTTKYPEAKKYTNWANILYYTKPAATSKKTDLVWINNKYAYTDSTKIEDFTAIKHSVDWGNNMIKKITTYIYSGKEYTDAPTKTEDKTTGKVTYVFKSGPTITVNKGESTGITKKVIYESSDWAARLYRGYTGDTGKGTGAVPYLMPIGTTTITSSSVLNNDGYGFSSTYTGAGTNTVFDTIEYDYK